MRLLPLISLIPALLLPLPALAQSIIPAADGTGTLVLPDGTTYTITGGTLSGDGANLFHSFEQFGLTANEVATFLANPAVQNILGRVVGGNASLIDGLMQVNGGANLYLINPAGILFGPNTVLNLEGSFTATSASGIGFGEAWLNALGQSDYSALNGDPTAFSFTENAGAILNSGNLAVGEGERITLMGGSVVNLGTLEAPGGQIMVLAVPGENRVILRPVGALLGLELAPLPQGAPSLDGLSPLDLPGLLRAGEPTIATGLATNPDGTVSLVGSTTALPTTPGTTITSGSLSVAGEQGGTVQILGDRVAVVGATVEASGRQGGGQVQIGGEYQGQGTTPTANRTFVDAATTITANAGETGQGGEVILWAEEATRFDGTITAQGGNRGGNGGFVEISGRQTLAFNGGVDVSAPNGEMGTLLLDPTNIIISATVSSPVGVEGSLPDILAAEFPGDIFISSVVLAGQTANVVLEATNNITIDPGLSLTFAPGVGSITFTADADNDGLGDFTMDTAQAINAPGDATNNGRAVTITGTNITVGAINTSVSIPGSTTSGGAITLSTLGNLAAGVFGNIQAGTLDSSSATGTGSGGAIRVLNDFGATSIDNVRSFSAAGTAGTVNLSANAGLLTVGGIINAGTTSGTAGVITLTNDSGGMTINDATGQSVSATSFAAQPFIIGGVVAIDAIVLANQGGTLAVGILETTTGNIRVASGPGGVINLDGAIAGGSIDLQTGAAGVMTTGNLSAGNQITATTGQGGTLRTLGLTAGLGGSGLSIDLQADEIDFPGGFGVIQAPGRLSIQAVTPGQSIVLGQMGDSGPGALDLTAIDLAALANGFSDIVIGGLSTVGNGAITLTGNVAFADPVTLRTNGPIDTANAFLIGTDNASLTLEAGTGMTTGALTTSVGAVTLVGDRDGDGSGAVNVAGSVTTNGGAITIAGSEATLGPGISLNSPGSLNSGGGAITLTGTSTAAGANAVGLGIGGAVNSQGGEISLTGQGTNGDILLSATGSLDAGTGTLVLNADDPRLVGTVQGLGTLQISPLTPTLPLTLGGTGDLGLTFLNAAELGQLGNSFSQRTIGQPSHTGTITLDSFTLSSPLAINGTTFLGPNQNTTWAPQFDGSVLVDGFGATLRLLNPTLITGGTANNTVLGTVGNDVITPTAANTLQLGATQFRNISIFDGLAGDDAVLSTAADDTVQEVGTNAIRFNNVRFNNVEFFSGGTGVNTVIGSGLTNTVSAISSATFDLNGTIFNNVNVFEGGAGNYTLIGTPGNDTFTLGGGNALQLGSLTFRDLRGLEGGGGFNTLVGTAGNDIFSLQSANGGMAQAIQFANINAIDTQFGQDVVALAGVPLNIPLTHGGGSLTLSNSSGGDVVLNANVQTSGNLVISTLVGAIHQTGGQIIANGTTRLEAGGEIALTGANDFNVVTVPRSQGLALVDMNDLVLGDLAFTNGLDIRATGNLTATRNLLATSSLGSGAPTGVFLTSGSALSTQDLTMPGGPIALQAGGPLTVGRLNTSGNAGGAVSLQSGDRIQVNSINAQGTTTGGSITATAATTFQALGSFLDRNGIAASLSTVGGNVGGPITLTYNTSAFTLGDASLNGTLAAITSGNVTLTPSQVVIGSRTFEAGLPGQVALIAPGTAPPTAPPTEPPTAPPTAPPTPASGDDNEVILDEDTVLVDLGDAPLNDGGEQPVLLTSTGQLLQESEFRTLEAEIASEFSSYLGDRLPPPRPVSLAAAQNILRDIQAQTGEVPALVYVRFNRLASPMGGRGALELLLVPPNGDPVRVQVLGANPQAVMQAQELLRRQLTNPSLTDNTAYLAPAQQLYNWIVAPIHNELEAAGITNLSFIMDGGLRRLPLAALHDGEQFLVERYGMGLVPSLGLIDPTYVDLNRQSATLIVGGASQFLNQPPLLAARAEIEAIAAFWPSTILAETDFTVSALQQTRQQAQIVHLATHAEFLRGAPEQSYIQFFDGRLSLANMAALRWFDPPVDLVTLSACQTAMGNLEAELGFAGFALQAGARSALASLWRVNDEATAGLMASFYQQLDQQTTKSEALRQAQLAFLRGEATIDNGQIRWPGGTLSLPPSLVFPGSQDLSHPFYWAAFTVVGSPW